MSWFEGTRNCTDSKLLRQVAILWLSDVRHYYQPPTAQPRCHMGLWMPMEVCDDIPPSWGLAVTV